ncbi:hypothetical protein [Pseudomonas sp. SW-3]|uniref:hypothetical protein n=1 Tax=Pseudomonas sp. SW-3 TaxID=147212 RepID=UPI001F3D6688|nr:hypothetical protein [Pseudomonas sp. SW-3]
MSKFVAAGITAFAAEHFSGCLPLFLAAAGVMVASGCSAIKPADSFTLLTELPPGFSIKGEASYVPRTGEMCSVPAKKGRNFPGLKFFEQKLSAGAQTARFEVPLTSTEGGCPLVLKSFGYEVDAKYGAARLNLGRDYTGIAFQDGIADSQNAPSPMVLQKQCEWFFRTVGPKRYIAKILECKSVATPEQENGTVAKGPLQLAQLVGKTVKVVFAISSEESPAMGDNWVKFPTGWKRCMGESLEDPYAFCNGNITDFKPFKMPDGRDCTVYPNCTEQGQ